jgi:hypothetical protein
MAIKDLSPATVADILILISQAGEYNKQLTNQEIESRLKKYGKGVSKKDLTIKKTNPLGIKTWYDTYIKSTAPAAGTSTFSTTFVSTKEYSTIFYTVRTALVSIPQDDATVKTIKALDAWLKSMDPEVRLNKKDYKR